MSLKLTDDNLVKAYRMGMSKIGNPFVLQSTTATQCLSFQGKQKLTEGRKEGRGWEGGRKERKKKVETPNFDF